MSSYPYRSTYLLYDSDAFAYDEAYLHEWHIPASLAANLPYGLREAIITWQCASAALCTTLARIEELEDESIHRGWPSKPSRFFPRQNSNPPSTKPPSRTVLPIVIPTSLHEKQKVLIDTHASPRSSPSESCSAAPSQAQPLLPYSCTPISPSRRDSTLTQADTASLFNEVTWETFIKSFRSEIDDVHKLSRPRMRGCTHTVENARKNWSGNGEQSDGLAETRIMLDFDMWWAEMRMKMDEFEVLADRVKEPRLDVVKLERAARGLPV